MVHLKIKNNHIQHNIPPKEYNVPILYFILYLIYIKKKIKYINVNIDQLLINYYSNHFHL